MQFWNRLKRLHLFTKEEKPEYFLVLILQDLEVHALVFKELGGRIDILGKSSQNLSSSIEEIEQGELVEICDKTISIAEENLPPNISPAKTIIGLKDEWVDEGRIKKEYLKSLKKLKEDLELEFIGFVVITEAICHLLQKEEGVPTTSILVGKEGDTLTVALVRAGRIAKLMIKKIEDKHYAQALQSLLKISKEHEVLPSRMTLFGQGNLEELRQELISFPWTKTLPFLHFPKIEVLEEDFVQRAVVAGFATQTGMAFEITKVDMMKRSVEEVENAEEVFGFMKEKDILKEEKAEEEIKRLRLPHFKLPSVLLNFSIPQISSFFVSIRLLRSKLFSFFLLTVLILIFLITAYIFLPKATITLYVAHRGLEMDREVIIDPTISATDPASNRIKADLVEAQVSDSLEGSATGKKEVGDKSKGEVVIYNSSTQILTLAANTVITSTNNVKFTLDDKVTIASASGDIFSGTTPSREKVRVTAVQIGEESNFPSGTTFTIGTITNVAAKNDSAFSGGSKKEVTVVSRTDQENLTKTLLDKLANVAKDEILKEESLEEKKIVDTALTQEILEKKFSKNVDEETSKFSLFLKAKFKTLRFSEHELQSLFENEVREAIPQDFVLKADSMNVSFGNTRLNRDKSVSSQVKIGANLLPKIDEKNIKGNIRGKSPEAALQILGTVPNVSDYKIKVSPIFPLLPRLLPWRIENIRIEILENA